MKNFEYCQKEACSCSACCGIYNWVGYNRELVQEVLERQTELFLKSDRTSKDLAKIKKELLGTRPKVLFPKIYNCEFVGFIDDEKKRVGCLLHPDLNDGKNLRDASFYGRETCDELYCTAYIYLKPEEARLIAKASQDWYLYGLCLTDIDLVKEFFRLASEKLGEEVKIEKVLANDSALSVFSEYLHLKESWEYARNPLRFGKYFFKGDKYFVASIDYAYLKISQNKLDKILMSLGSEFKSKEEIIRARDKINSLLRQFLKSL